MNLLRVLMLMAGLLGFLMCTRTRLPSQAELSRIDYASGSTGETRSFFLYLPAGFHEDTLRRWPVMLFLHGNGERGNGRDELDWVLMHGPLYEAWIQKRNLPFLIISPQLPMYGMDTVATWIARRDPGDIPRRLDDGVPPRPLEFVPVGQMTGAMPADAFPYVMAPRGWECEEDDLLAMIQTVVDTFRGDADRVIVTGISYGGMGTWYLASRHPGRFAAIAPVVGWGHPSLMPPIAAAQLPLWAFAAGRDEAMPSRYFYPGLNALEAAGHASVRFTVHADRAHDAWRRIYAGEDLYAWLLMQRRK